MTTRGISEYGKELLIAVFVTVVPASVLVGARFFARAKFTTSGICEDDWVLLAALAFAWIMGSLRIYVITQDGLGYHMDTLKTSQVADFQKAFLAIQTTYFMTAALTKTSILLLYRRLFGVSTKFKVTVYCLLVLVACYPIACILTAVCGCQPISYFWNKEQDGSCIDETQFFRWNGVANIILDVAILLLPMPMVWRLHMSKGRKAAISGIFLVGGFACVASAFRIVQFETSRQTDPTYTTVGSITWSSIEQNVGICCACLPTLRPLFTPSFWRGGGVRETRGGSNYRRTSFEMGTAATRATSRPTYSQNRQPWDEETESEKELAMYPSKNTYGTAAFYGDEDKSDEEQAIQSSQLSPPAVGIMRTQEVEQHTDALPMTFYHAKG